MLELLAFVVLNAAINKIIVDRMAAYLERTIVSPSVDKVSAVVLKPFFWDAIDLDMVGKRFPLRAAINAAVDNFGKNFSETEKLLASGLALKLFDPERQQEKNILIDDGLLGLK